MSGNSEKPGIVYLVGAGPGHPGLITRMGYDLLQRCDAVAYDALIPLELISSLPQRVERYYVGRRAGKHSMPQSEKNRLLVELASRGLKVVRLKGGDTSFFGGSSEEAETLAAAGIPVVVVPGVTAASAVAAVSGLPLTGRRDASWVFFATGHGSTADALPVPWREIAALNGGTVVIYMGLANLQQIVSQFLESGQAADTPCMVVQGATTGLQRILESKLGEVISDCSQKQMKPPALAIVGNVVQHRTPSSSPLRPLSGKRVLTACCAQEIEAVCAGLRDCGAEPLPYPAYILDDGEDEEGWTRFSQIATSGGWCLFTSELEVRGFAEALLRHGLDLRSLGKFRIAASGRGAEAALLQRNLRADAVVSFPKFARHDLVQSGKNPERLVIFSDDVTIEKTEWAEVLRLKLFREKPAFWEPHWIQEIRNNPPDFVLFRNPSEVDGFVNILGMDAARASAGQSKVIATDEATESAIHRHGLRFSAEEGTPFNFLLESRRDVGK
jgi:uroporphyrinogen III methyltransferase / synthase